VRLSISTRTPTRPSAAQLPSAGSMRTSVLKHRRPDVPPTATHARSPNEPTVPNGLSMSAIRFLIPLGSDAARAEQRVVRWVGFLNAAKEALEARPTTLLRRRRHSRRLPHLRIRLRIHRVLGSGIRTRRAGARHRLGALGRALLDAPMTTFGVNLVELGVLEAAVGDLAPVRPRVLRPCDMEYVMLHLIFSLPHA